MTDSARGCLAGGLFEVSNHYTSRSELHGLCPFHGEKTASFGYNYGKDVYSCQSCDVTGDLIDLWCHKNGHDRKHGGLKAFCEDCGLDWSQVKDFLGYSQGSTPAKKSSKSRISKPKNSPDADKIDESAWLQTKLPITTDQPETPEEKIIPEAEWDALPLLPDDMIEELKVKRSWTREGIEKAGLRLYVHTKEGSKMRRLPFGERRVAIPVRDDAGVLRNVRLYAPFGTKETYQKMTSWGQGYGTSRLLPSPSSWPTGPLWYCEGEPDWICALSQGLNAVTKTIGAKVHKKEWLKHFQGRDVVFCYDADKTGLSGAEKGAVMLSKEAESVRVLMWPRFMYIDNPAEKWDGKSDFSPFVMSAGEEYPQDHGWDLTDFITKFGKTVRDLRDLLPSAKTFSRPKHEDVEMGGAARFFGGARGTTFKPVLLAEAYLKDHPIVADPKSKRPFLWNGQYFEEYETDYIETAVTKMLEQEAKTNYINDASNIILKLSTLEYGRQFNDRPEWVCLKSGMLNLETGEHLPHSQEFYASYQLGVSFDPNAKEQKCPRCNGTPGDDDCPECWGRGYLYACQRWIQFLKETVQVKDTILQLQEFFGYCLTRETRFGKCLLMTGPGSDGKSKVLDILQLLVGEDNCSAVSLTELEKSFSRAMIYNKALNVSAEIDSGAIHSETFKKLVTGDTVSAEFKHRDGFQFRFWGKLAFAANNPPRILDNSDGLFRRFLVVRFKRQFLEDDPNTDPYLDMRLRSEIDGILVWALDGAARLFEQKKFTYSEDSAAALMDFKRDNNPILNFAEDRLLYRPEKTDMRVSKERVYEEYKKYCGKWGYSPAGGTHFGRGLKGVYKSLADGRLKDGNRDKCYVGLTFADSDESQLILSREESRAFASSPDPSTGLGPNNEGSQFVS
jgi:putative DNA primase/helicase